MFLRIEIFGHYLQMGRVEPDETEPQYGHTGGFIAPGRDLLATPRRGRQLRRFRAAVARGEAQ